MNSTPGDPWRPRPTAGHHQHRRQERGRRPVRHRACPVVADSGRTRASSRPTSAPGAATTAWPNPATRSTCCWSLMELTAGHGGRRRRRPDRDERRPEDIARRPADHRGEHAGRGRRSAVRGVPGTADRHGLRDPARSGDRRPPRVGHLDRRSGPRRSGTYPGRWSSTSPTTSRPRTSSSTRASPCGRCRATSTPMVSVCYTELEEKIGGTSELADYLIRQLKEWNATYHPEPDRVPLAGRLTGGLVAALPPRWQFRPSRRPGSARRSLPTRIRTSRSGSCEVRRRAVPARGHVRQDPQVRPRTRSAERRAVDTVAHHRRGSTS